MWTRGQSRQLREHVRPHRSYAVFLLPLCGLRRSETMGMEWGAVDFSASTVEVRQGRIVVTATETEIGDPKSWRSGSATPRPYSCGSTRTPTRKHSPEWVTRCSRRRRHNNAIEGWPVLGHFAY